MYQWARTHLRSLNVGLPSQEKKRDTYLHVATVMLSLEVSSGNILSKELILLRSCAPGALWIGPCRIPPDSKFQTASRAFLPNTLGSFPGSSLGLALLPPTWPSCWHWEHPRDQKLRKAGGRKGRGVTTPPQFGRQNWSLCLHESHWSHPFAGRTVCSFCPTCSRPGPGGSAYLMQALWGGHLEKHPPADVICAVPASQQLAWPHVGWTSLNLRTEQTACSDAAVWAIS